MEYCRFLLTAPVLLLAVACGNGPGDGTGTSGTGSPSAGSGNTATGGSSTTTTGGSATSSGGLAPIPLAGSGQAIGGGDQGSLFPPDGDVPIMPDMGGSGGSGGTPSTIPGDGKMVTSMIRSGGQFSGTAVFSQKGEDVTVVVNLMNCPAGNHMFQIFDGDSCDNAGTEGMPWGLRGTGWGPAGGIQCTNNVGTMMDTRLGADKTKNVTVGTHDLSTDVSTHVVIVSDEKDPTSRAACGNFF